MSVFSKKLRARARARERAVREPSTLRNVLWGLFTVLIVVLLGALTWYLTRLDAVTISQVTVAGGETISPDVVRVKVEGFLDDNYFLLIPHRFSYFYPHDAIVSALRSIPRVHDVTVTRSSLKTVDVTFAEYVPYALWCLTEDDLSPCYFLDASGYAFAPSPALQGGSLTRHILEGRGEFVQETVIRPELLKTIELFMRGLEKELGLRVISVVHTKDGDLRYNISGGGSLLVALDRDVTATFENLKSVLTSKEFQHVKPGNFNYIDLRFGNKVFVNEELVTATSTATSTETILPE